MAINDYKLSYSGAKIDELLTKVNSMPDDLSGLKYQIVTELPTENIDASTIYLVETSSHDYNEWIYVNNTWEMLGNTAVDLTGYATKKYVDDSVAGAIMPATLSHYAADSANIAMLDACVILDMASGAFGITRPALLQTEGYYFAYLSNVSIDTANNKVMYTFTGLTDVVYGAADSEVGTVEAIITRDMTAGTLTKAYSVKNIATKQYVDEKVAAAGGAEGKLDALGSITGIWGGSQAEYDALTTKDPKVLYFIQE